MTISSKLSTRSWRCYPAQIRGLSVKRHGAIGNKLMSFHSDMSAVGHKCMDSRGEMVVSSGIKTGTSVTMKKSSWQSALMAV